MINKSAFLFKVKNDIDVFLLGESEFIFSSNKNYFDLENGFVYVDVDQDYEHLILNLAHEIFHYYQGKEYIKKYVRYKRDYHDVINSGNYPPFEREAIIFSYRYLYFIEKTNKIENDFIKDKRGRLESVNCFDIDDFDKDDVLFRVKIRFKEKKKEYVKLISFQRESGDDVAHVSLKENGHLWFGFHNEREWVDLVFPYYIYIDDNDININVTKKGRDFLQVKEIDVCSFYENENKNYIDLISSITIKRKDMVDVKIERF